MRIVNIEGKNFDYLCDVCGHLEPKKTGTVHYLNKDNFYPRFNYEKCPFVNRKHLFKINLKI